MFKKLITAFTVSAVAVLGLVSVAGASTGDSFDIAGLIPTYKVVAADYTNFTIANGDPAEEGVAAQIKVQPLGLASASEDEGNRVTTPTSRSPTAILTKKVNNLR